MILQYYRGAIIIKFFCESFNLKKKKKSLFKVLMMFTPKKEVFIMKTHPNEY